MGVVRRHRTYGIGGGHHLVREIENERRHPARFVACRVRLARARLFVRRLFDYVAGGERNKMITVKGKTRVATVEPKVGRTLLEHALSANVDFAFNCSRGTCARCRCLVEEGADLLSEVGDTEWDRLEPDEFDAGYRLGCQAVVAKEGVVRAVNRPYF